MSVDYVMSEEKKKELKPNEAPVAHVDDLLDFTADTYATAINDLDTGITDQLGASRDGNLEVKTPVGAVDLKHGTNDLASAFDTDPLMGFMTGATAKKNDDSAADQSEDGNNDWEGSVDNLSLMRFPDETDDSVGAQSPAPRFEFVPIDRTASEQADDGRSSVDEPRISADNMTFIPRIPAEDFMALNQRLFNYEVPDDFVIDKDRTVTLVVAGHEVVVHGTVLAHSETLDELFEIGSVECLLRRAEFPDVGLQELKILMLAMYGIKTPILGHQEYKGVDYIKALSLANRFHCDEEVYEAVAQCARGHFSALKKWMSIPYNSMTQDLHRDKILEVNEAYKAYKQHVRKSGPRAFTDNSFAILLLKLCPGAVYCLYSDLLDGELVLQISKYGMLQRDYEIQFSREEMKLFTCPSI